MISCVLSVRTVNGRPASGKLLVHASGPLDPLVIGDIVWLRGKLQAPAPPRNPGTFDYAGYLRRQGIRAELYTRSLTKLYERAPVFPLLPFAFRVREHVLDSIRARLPHEEASILAPMLVGEKSWLSPEDKRAFRDSGLMHILVVSGLNVGYVAAIFLGLFHLTGLRRRYAAILTIPFILLYVLITGMNPPVMRAGVMAVFVIVSLALSREPDIYQSLSLAALCILLGDPQSLFTASFQLSFAATLGIVVLYSLLVKPLEKLPRWLRISLGAVLAVTLAAQFAVTPLIAYYFHRVSLVSLVSNLVAVPMAGLITGTGLLLYGTHLLAPPLAPLVAGFNFYLLHFLRMLVEWFSLFPHATINVVPPSIGGIAAYYVLLIGIVVRSRRSSRKTSPDTPPPEKQTESNTRKLLKARVISVCAGVMLILAAWMILFPRARQSEDRLRIVFLDAGSADVTHIAWPDGKHWLVYGGRKQRKGFDAGEKVICPYLRTEGVSRIERLLVPYAAGEDGGALRTVIENFPIGEIACNRATLEESSANELFAIIRERRIYSRELKAGYLAKEETSALQVLNGGDRSLAVPLLLEHRGKRILLAGGCDRESSGRFPARKQELRADVAQISNRGKTDTSWGVISASGAKTVIATGGWRKLQVPGGLIWADQVYSTKGYGAVAVEVSDDGVRIERAGASLEE